MTSWTPSGSLCISRHIEKWRSLFFRQNESLLEITSIYCRWNQKVFYLNINNCQDYILKGWTAAVAANATQAINKKIPPLKRQNFCRRKKAAVCVSCIYSGFERSRYFNIIIEVLNGRLLYMKENLYWLNEAIKAMIFIIWQIIKGSVTPEESSFKLCWKKSACCSTNVSRRQTWRWFKIMKIDL